MPDPAPGHAAHDALLVAAHAAGDAEGADLGRAAALVASCPECARLHRDLRALAAALASAPAPARPRDFGITPARAAALRRPRGWRRLLAPLAGARSAAGPLAASLAALGLAGLLLGGGLRLPLGGAGTAALAPERAGASAEIGAAASAPAAGNYDTNAAGAGEAGAPSTAALAAPPVAAAAPSAAPSMAAASAAASHDSTYGPSPAAVPATQAPAHVDQSPAAASSATGGSVKVVGQGSSSSTAGGPSDAGSSAAAVLAPAPYATEAPGEAQAALGGEGSGPSPLVLGSLALLVAGIVVGVLRLVARRLVP